MYVENTVKIRDFSGCFYSALNVQNHIIFTR
nr:MAG TPA: hypothetical protein [Caudoviricetes sp.]